MSERRYTDQEVAAIFRDASERQQRGALAPGTSADAPDAPEGTGAGMTLAQVQEIAREVGIPADLVARAAGALDRGERRFVRRYLGLPIGVGRTVGLDRRLSDAEWEQLVVLLRETFDARGRVRDEGGFKQWTNGNLQALLEPTPEGHRLRLKTMKGNSFAWMNTGLAMIGFSALLEIAKLFTAGGFGGDSPATLLVALMGGALFTFGAIQLPGWARLRQRQMDAIADRLLAAGEPRAASQPEVLPR